MGLSMYEYSFLVVSCTRSVVDGPCSDLFVVEAWMDDRTSSTVDKLRSDILLAGAQRMIVLVLP